MKYRDLFDKLTEGELTRIVNALQAADTAFSELSDDGALDGTSVHPDIINQACDRVGDVCLMIRVQADAVGYALGRGMLVPEGTPDDPVATVFLSEMPGALDLKRERPCVSVDCTNRTQTGICADCAMAAHNGRELYIKESDLRWLREHPTQTQPTGPNQG